MTSTRPAGRWLGASSARRRRVTRTRAARWRSSSRRSDVYAGHLEIAKLLISHGAKVDARGYIESRPGPQPIHRAARGGHLKIVEYLVSHGANVNAQNHHGKTALHHAAISGHLELAKFLVDNGAEVFITDRWGKTPLQLAERNNFFTGKNRVVGYLISQQTDNGKNVQPVN